ncbi:lysylphosphatidylglycerol synthase transmembrane domain-containing protein [Methanococcus maripaludis]|uniref:Flippase-like domain-containing protein n=1 Tax=Methanococcus maripaludis TaxID=39152 RepID=A0A8T3W532_METMI|nr:lysylphosphatidylglycerol synthase transmembrane domain-containing protein [Methanococcus maripaludis]MBG0768303.1 flippase-like domain-containing protein [Methanococcus maripaludis]
MQNLKKQFLNKKTYLSFLISFLILYWIFSKIDFYLLVSSIKNTNLIWFFIAFSCFYASVFLKSIRWKLLLKDAEINIDLKDSFLIFYLSMFANSVVPAKIGDVYRSYLLKQKNNAPISLSFATVFVERIFDLMTMIPLLLIFGIISFNANIPLEVFMALKYGIALIILLIVFTLIFLKLNAKVMAKINNKLIKNIFTNFEKGIRTLKVRSIPKLFLLSLISWITEGFTIYFIFLSIGLNFDVLFSIFTDLSSSLLTAIPFTPSGLGIVEYALVFILNLKNTGITESSVVIVLYRAISYFSIVILGSIAHFMYGIKK